MAQEATIDLADIMGSIFRPIPAGALKPVFPLYVMSRVRHGINSNDPRRPAALTFNGFETIGDCRYAANVSDEDGNRYRITVEVVSQ